MPKGCIKLSKVALLFSIITLLQVYSYAQGLINNGAKIVITETSHIYINGVTGHFKNQSGGVITNSTAGGTLTVGGNWDNQALNSVFSNDGSTVVFNSSSAQNITGTSPTAFYNINASNGGTKTFSAVNSTLGRLLTVGNSTTVNANGSLTILSTATSNGSVGPLLNGAVVTNNVVVQSFMTGGQSDYRAFRGISSPINDALVSGNKTFKQLQSKLIITGTGGTTNGFDKGSAASPSGTTVRIYNEAAPLSQSQFSTLPNITTATTPGKGYFLFFRGNRTSNYDASGTYATGSKVIAPFSTPESVTVDYTGPINQGNISVPLSYTNNNDSDIFIGSNLVGNPYPSVIDWHAVKAASSASISPNIYIIRQDGSFAVYNSSSQLTTNGGTRYIMPGQAFYVQTNAASQTLNFVETVKDPYPVSGSVMRFLSAPSKDVNTVLAGGINPHHVNASGKIRSLKMSLQTETATEEAIVAFQDDAEMTYDEKDALYFGGSSIILATRSADEKNLAINVMPEIAEDIEVKLNVVYPQGGDLSLKFGNLNDLGAGQLFLVDSYSNKLEKVSNNFIYPFTVNPADAKSYGSERLKIVFKPLINIKSFNAKKIFGGSEIKWSGITQKNKSFIIERSVDNEVFSELGAVTNENKVGKEYDFLDARPHTGMNFYRLKFLDADGKYTYSNIATLDYSVEKSEPLFIAFPNPVKDVLNVQLRQFTKECAIMIYSLNGSKLLESRIVDSNRGIINASGLEAGVYLLRVIDANNKEVGSEKIIKN